MEAHIVAPMRTLENGNLADVLYDVYHEIKRLRAEIERLRKALAKIAQYDMQFIAIDALCPDERIREKRRSDAHER
jgi:hypothetical protein